MFIITILDLKTNKKKEFRVGQTTTLLKAYLKVPFQVVKIDTFEFKNKHTLLIEDKEFTCTHNGEQFDLTKIYNELNQWYKCHNQE